MIIIGEKINGSIPSVRKAIVERDETWIKNLAKSQSEAGADYLDICASVEEPVEVETLKWLIELVQEVFDTPICVDSPSPQACVEGMKFCKDTGIVNSVSLEGDKIDIVFPAIENTDWGCIALLCDDNGIPGTAGARLKVFEGIMEKAKEYKIAPTRLYIDSLVVTLSTEKKAFTTFAEVTREIKRQYPDIHVVSGLSNISYGLPSRSLINQAFMALSMQAGMDSAIVDPTNSAMAGIIYATNTLLEKDDYCLNYINAYRKGII